MGAVQTVSTRLLVVGQIEGKPLRFFASPLPGEDLPWHAVEDLLTAMSFFQAGRRDVEAKIRREWGSSVRMTRCGSASVMIGPHWMAQGLTSARDGCDDGYWFTCYCRAVQRATRELTVGMTPQQATSFVMRAAVRAEGGHLH